MQHSFRAHVKKCILHIYYIWIMSKLGPEQLCFVVTKVEECWPKAWGRPADHRGESETDAGLYCPSLIACTPHAGMPLKITAVYCNFFGGEITGGFPEGQPIEQANSTRRKDVIFSYNFA